MWRSGFLERESKPFLVMIPKDGDRRFVDPQRRFNCGADSDLDSNCRMIPAVVTVCAGVSDDNPSYTRNMAHELDVALDALDRGYPMDIARDAPVLIQWLQIGDTRVPRARILVLLARPPQFHEAWKIVEQGAKVFQELLADRDPEVQVAAAALVVKTAGYSAARAVGTLLAVASKSTDPLVRASMWFAASQIARAETYSHDSGYRILDDHPTVRFAQAAYVASCERKRLSPECEAILRAEHESVDPTRFPFGGGVVAGLAGELLDWLQLPDLETALTDLEVRAAAVDSRMSDLALGAEALIPRIFGRLPLKAELSTRQRRLHVLLSHVYSPELFPLGLAPVAEEEVRAALHLEWRVLRLRGQVKFAEWKRDNDQDLAATFARGCEVPGLYELRSRDDRCLGVFVSEKPLPLSTLLCASGAVALSGGKQLAAWLATSPEMPSLCVLRLTDGEDELDALASSSILGQLRRLQLAHKRHWVPLLTSHRLHDLEALHWEMAAHSPTSAIAHLRSLRDLHLIAHPEHPDPTLPPLLAPLEMLTLEQFSVRLADVLSRPTFALRELRFGNSRVLDGDGDVSRLHELCARADKLEKIVAAGSTLNTVIARTFTSLPRLRALDLRGTSVVDLELLAELARTPAMEHLQVSARALLELWLRGVTRALPAVTESFLQDWRPRVVIAGPAEKLGSPPDGFTRQFIYERDVVCPGCAGSGTAPDGPCGYHSLTEYVRFVGPEPPVDRSIDAIVGTLARAELELVTLASELRRAGFASISRIVWHIEPGNVDGAAAPSLIPPRSMVDVIAGAGPLARTPAWPYGSLFEHPNDPLHVAAAAITELGFGIIAITQDAIHLAIY